MQGLSSVASHSGIIETFMPCISLWDPHLHYPSADVRPWPATLQVANTTGDVRRALEILRRAVEIAEAEKRKGISQSAKPSGSSGGSKEVVTVSVALQLPCRNEAGKPGLFVISLTGRLGPVGVKMWSV
jgi:hypothetical protein